MTVRHHSKRELIDIAACYGRAHEDLARPLPSAEELAEESGPEAA